MITGALVGLAVMACEDNCDRAGCEALERPAQDASISAGIAGVAASESDLVANGCQECTLSQGTLEVWTAATAVTTVDDAAALVASGDPTDVVQIDERYELALEPGEVLVCTGDRSVCAGVTIAVDAVVTVHGSYPYGEPSLVVFEAGVDEPRTDRMFEL